MAHVMPADASHQPFGHQDARSQSLGDSGGDVANAAPIVLHRQVLKVLLDGSHGNDAGLQFARLHSLAKLATRHLAQQDFLFIHG